MSLSQQVKNHGQTLKQLQAQYQQRQTQLQKTHIDVGRLTITAPFSGYLTQLYVHEGDRVATQTALLKLYDPQSLEIHSQIPLQYAQQISGDNTTATTQYQKQIIPLNLTRISKHIEATQSTVNAIFHPNQTFSPPIGQWLEITIALPPVAQSFIVPEQAIYHNNTVYKIDQNTLKAIPVTMMGHAHQKAHHMVIVSKSLHHGDTILTTPLPNATTGLQVMPSEDNTP